MQNYDEIKHFPTRHKKAVLFVWSGDLSRDDVKIVAERVAEADGENGLVERYALEVAGSLAAEIGGYQFEVVTIYFGDGRSMREAQDAARQYILTGGRD